MIQIPDALLRDWARKEGVDLPEPGHYAVAMCFLPQDEKARAFAIKRFEHFVKVEKQKIVGWRDVPTNLDGLGKAVIASMPVIRMAIVGRSSKLADQDAFERKLLAIRKQTQNPLADLEKKHKLPGLSQLYMPSFSSRTVVYKGLLLPSQLPAFYGDLRDPELVSAIAVVHSRFSTNTFPTWDLAQPFRFIANDHREAEPDRAHQLSHSTVAGARGLRKGSAASSERWNSFFRRRYHFAWVSAPSIRVRGGLWRSPSCCCSTTS
eukprot:gene56513-75463_t